MKLNVVVLVFIFRFYEIHRKQLVVLLLWQSASGNSYVDLCLRAEFKGNENQFKVRIYEEGQFGIKSIRNNGKSMITLSAWLNANFVSCYKTS